MKIEFVKTHEKAILPKKAHPNKLTGDAGFDIFLTEDVEILPRKSVIVNVGLKVGYITPGYWFRIEGRSGLGFKQDVSPFLGIIDNSYRGNVGIKIYNDSYDVQKIEKGKAIAQFIVYEMIDCKVSFAKEVSKVEAGARGEGGFGHTDKKFFGESFENNIDLFCTECYRMYENIDKRNEFKCICGELLIGKSV